MGEERRGGPQDDCSGEINRTGDGNSIRCLRLWSQPDLVSNPTFTVY